MEEMSSWRSFWIAARSAALPPAVCPPDAAGTWSTCPANGAVNVGPPIPRKHFQAPSGIFFRTINLVPLNFFGSPSGDSTYEPVMYPHSTAQPSQIVTSFVSGT